MLAHVVKAGLSPDVQRGDGCTCLHVAAWTMNRELAGTLEALGASGTIANQSLRPLSQDEETWPSSESKRWGGI